jgi:methionine sulfoxide reductase heme-binding subunit
VIASFVDPIPHVWWLASRAAGVVALMLVTLSVGIGLALAGKVVRKRGAGPRLTAIHEYTALAGLIAIAVHGVTLLGDPWLHPGVGGITVPFAMSYRSFFTGLGIVGGWLAAFLGLTFYVRRWIGPGLWRRMHRATVVVYLLGVVHTLGAGTDGGSAWLRLYMVVTGVPIAMLFANRVFGRRPQPQPRPVRRRVPRPAEDWA